MSTDITLPNACLHPEQIDFFLQNYPIPDPADTWFQVMTYNQAKKILGLKDISCNKFFALLKNYADK